MSQAESADVVKGGASNEVADFTDLITSVARLSPDILYVYDLVSRSNVYSNDGIETVLGYSVAEVKAMGETLIASLMHPDDLPTYLEQVVARYAKARDGESIRHRYRMRHRNGSWRWLESHEIVYKRLADGRPQQILGAIRDVTEQQQTLAALERSQQLLHQSQKVARIGHFVLDVATGTWTGSAVLDELYGIPSDHDRSVQAWLAVVHPDHRDGLRDQVAAVMAGRIGSIDQEFMIQKVDTGEVRWVHGLGTVESGPDGSPKRLFGTIQDITLRKRSELRLQESEHKFRHITSHLNIGVFMSTLTGRFIYVNESVARIGGYDSVEEFLAVPAQQLYPMPDEREGLVRALQAQGSVQNYRAHSRRKDGTVYLIAINATIQHDAVGTPEYILGTVEDVTERTRALEALAASERRLAQIFESTGTANALFDRQCRLVLQNSLSKAYLGTQGDEAYGKDVIEVFGPERGPVVKARMLGVLASGRPRTFETQFGLVTGTRWFRSVYEPLHDEAGAITGVQVISQDITEPRLFEQHLAQEKERLAVTLRSIADGVIATDQAGCVQIINAAAEAMTGWKLEDALGRPLHEIYRTFFPDTREPCPNPVDQVLVRHGGGLLSDPATLASRDGSERAIASSGAPILAATGDVLGLVLVFRDISERQRLLDTVNRQQKLEALGILAGGIAHDFNNLLGGILGNVDLAMYQTQEPQVREYLETALSSMNRARSLTRQLLTFAKGGAPLKKVESLFPMVRDAVTFALSGTSVSASFEVAADLSRAEIDRNQLGQVIDNLVINAVQAMPAGGQLMVSAENATVSERDNLALRPGRYARLSFTDTGVGIPHDIQSKIFDPFFTTKQKGSGLGLATSYSIVQRHGGAILVSSEPGRGSTFTVLLPAVDGAPEAEDPGKNGLPMGTGEVLVMDDEEAVRITAGAMLGKLGYAWIGTGNGQEAIDLITRFVREGRALAFAILDLTVSGGKGGLEAAREIHAMYPALPLFVASGYAEDPVIANPSQYGFLDSIRKPFTTSELGNMLARNRERLANRTGR
jgi:PAS domain S-box-containing protein